MNLFSHYKQRENHCTNILMNLFAMDDARLLKLFAAYFLPQADDLNFGDPLFVMFAESPAFGPKEFEYVLGIAPFPRKASEDEIRPNPSSIPDAWVLGQNVTILMEFKVTGTIDEAQFSAHRSKLSVGCREVEFSWKQISQFLQEVEAEPVMAFLLEQFAVIISDLESPRPASGMPKQIISGRKAQPGEPYFIITGNASIGKYKVAVMLPDSINTVTLTEGIGGIQESRRWIERYIEGADDPAAYLASDRVVIDQCVNPDREKKPWNRWYLGTQNA